MEEVPQWLVHWAEQVGPWVLSSRGALVAYALCARQGVRDLRAQLVLEEAEAAEPEELVEPTER